jgi:ribosomal protein L34
MKTKIRHSGLKKRRLSGFLKRRTKPGGRKVIARQRKRKQ